MGMIEFFVICVIVTLLGWLAVYALKTLAPDHPKVIDNIIWFVVVIIIVVVLVQAMGLTGYDPKIPRVR